MTVLQMSGLLCLLFALVGIGLAHLDRRDDR